MIKYIFPVVLAMSFSLVSCKSTVTAQKVLKQEQEAQEELKEAQEEMIELAQMKEKYSVDGVKAQIAELKKRQNKIGKDIDKLDDITTDSAQDDANSMVKNLKQESAMLGEKISALESLPKENWAEAIEAINQNVADLENQIKRITQNIDRSAE